MTLVAAAPATVAPKSALWSAFGRSTKRTAAQMPTQTSPADQASNVASDPFASTVGEKHQRVCTTAAAVVPKRDAARQSTSPASTTTTMVATRAATRSRRNAASGRLKSMCSNGGTEPEGVVPRRGSTTRSPAANPHLGRTGAPQLKRKSRLAQRVAAAAMCTPSSAVCDLSQAVLANSTAWVSASRPARTTARRRDTLLPAARGCIGTVSRACTTAPTRAPAGTGADRVGAAQPTQGLA